MQGFMENMTSGNNRTDDLTSFFFIPAIDKILYYVKTPIAKVQGGRRKMSENVTTAGDWLQPDPTVSSNSRITPQNWSPLVERKPSVCKLC